MNRKSSVALTLVTVFALLSSVARAAIPPTVPLWKAPKAARPRGYPVCHSSQVRGLPSRAAFETDDPAFQMQAILSAQDERNKLLPDGVWASVFTPADFGPDVPRWVPRNVTGKWLDAQRFFWRFVTYHHRPISLSELVSTFRTELGFRDGDTPVQVGNRVYRRYANGAMSLGDVRAMPAEHFGTGCFTSGGHGPGFSSTLPPTLSK